jgi:hypothetical protein
MVGFEKSVSLFEDIDDHIKVRLVELEVVFFFFFLLDLVNLRNWQMDVGEVAEVPFRRSQWHRRTGMSLRCQ